MTKQGTSVYPPHLKTFSSHPCVQVTPDMLRVVCMCLCPGSEMEAHRLQGCVSLMLDPGSQPLFEENVRSQYGFRSQFRFFSSSSTEGCTVKQDLVITMTYSLPAVITFLSCVCSSKECLPSQRKQPSNTTQPPISSPSCDFLFHHKSGFPS